MHLFRGSGLSGLSGMQDVAIIPEFDPTIKIIRPLLTFWRQEIENYCDLNQVNFVVDETNADNIYSRNRLRNEIIPMLNLQYPGLNERILSMANIVGKDDEFLQSITDEAWNDLCIDQQEQFVQLNKNLFVSLPIAVQRRIIRKAVFSLKPNLRDLSFKNIGSLIDFLNKNKPGEIDLQENLVALIANEYIYFGAKSKEWLDAIFPQLTQELRIDAEPNSKYEISPNWILSITQYTPQTLEPHQPDNEYSAYVDGGKIQNSIRVRTRKSGDKFQPLGLINGTMKVSDFFVNEKLISPVRAKWPLVTTIEGEIIWIPGFRLDHKYSISEKTSKILKLSLFKKD